MGEWSSPKRLCFAKDRLYLVVPNVKDDENDEDEYDPEGHRILVLSLQGDILQVITHPTQLRGCGPTVESICCFDHKLLVSYESEGVLALQGL